MPNQRDPEKRRVSFWLDKAKKDRLQRVADEKGLTVTELVEEMLQREIENKRQDKSNGSGE